MATIYDSVVSIAANTWSITKIFYNRILAAMTSMAGLMKSLFMLPIAISIAIYKVIIGGLTFSLDSLNDAAAAASNLEGTSLITTFVDWLGFINAIFPLDFGFVMFGIVLSVRIGVGTAKWILDLPLL